MRTAILSAVVAAFVGVLAVPARAEVKSVTGELVSIMCVQGNGDKGRGEEHVSCAVRCAKQGYALGVLTADGVIYKVVGAKTADNNAALQPLLGKTVVATGQVAKDGDDQTIEATEITPASHH